MINENELGAINKPAQYLGGELNSINKTGQAIDVNFCLAFPDTYEVGMSHVGFQIIYDLVNRIPNFWAQRVYQPEPDFEKLIKSKNVTLYSLEAKQPLNEFDIVGFSLQYELCMHGVLSILELGKIPLFSKDRNESDPLIIAGGPVAYHPEPFSDFFDAFLIGDGEELVPEFLHRYNELKKLNLSRKENLDRLSEIPGVYIPSLFEAEYDKQGNFVNLKNLKTGYQKIRRRVIASLENSPFPKKPIVPNIQAVHDRLSIEVMRGCVRGCRFCQAGYLYRPQRERPPEEIIELVKESLKSTGYEELSLLSLSTADYCSILPLLSQLKEQFAKNNETVISFPSTRVDALTPELLQEVQSVRRSGFTMAPEAGTQRLRDLINKGVTEAEVLETCRNVFKLGWHSVKLYFMIGLPTETDQDIQGIIDLARQVKKIAGRKSVTVSVSTHVPKPHTPFQWAKQISIEETKQKQDLLRLALRRNNIIFRYHDAESSFLEGVFARGDRKLSQSVLRAYQLGCRLSGWVEKLDFKLWMQAFKESNINPHHYLDARQEESVLPWEHIDCDISKHYFLKEWKKAQRETTTPDCLKTSCSSCGACDYDSQRNVLFDRKRTESRLNIINPAWQAIIEKRQAGQTENLLADYTHNEHLESSNYPEKHTGSYKLKEYLQTEASEAPITKSAKSADALQRIRINFSKTGTARYQGHLGLASVFFRACRRANLPLAFTQGFNPKPRLQFGPPLQLGIESHCELVDFFLTEKINAVELPKLLNAVLPEGLYINSSYEIPLKAKAIQAEVANQTYTVKSQKAIIGNDPINWQNLSVRRTRKGFSESVALVDHLLNVGKVECNKLSFQLAHYSSAKTLKPSEVAETLTGLKADALLIVKTECNLNSV